MHRRDPAVKTEGQPAGGVEKARGVAGVPQQPALRRVLQQRGDGVDDDAPAAAALDQMVFRGGAIAGVKEVTLRQGRRHGVVIPRRSAQAKESRLPSPVYNGTGAASPRFLAGGRHESGRSPFPFRAGPAGTAQRGGGAAAAQPPAVADLGYATVDLQRRQRLRLPRSDLLRGQNSGMGRGRRAATRRGGAGLSRHARQRRPGRPSDGPLSAGGTGPRRPHLLAAGRRPRRADRGGAWWC